MWTRRQRARAIVRLIRDTFAGNEYVDRVGLNSVRGRRLRAAAIIVALLAGSLSAKITSASEFGISTYRPGLMDLYSGYLPPAGTVMVKNYFLFQDSNTQSITSNGQIEVRSHTVSYTEAVLLAYVSHFSVFGASWGFGAIPMFRLSEQTLRVGPPGMPVPRKNSTVAGPGDFIFLPCMLGWNLGQFHIVGALAFYAPTGSYDRQRIIDTGDNRWAIEPDVGLTWLDERTGRHFSVFTGYTFNFENTSTHYLSGQEFHTDFVFAQGLPRNWLVGLVGYALQQTTGDSGSGAIFGAYRGRVFGLGPLIGRTLVIAELPATFTLKYYFEFAAQNRATGNELWFNTTLHF